MKNVKKIAQMMLLVLVLTIGFIPALPAFAAYVDPPTISYDVLLRKGWKYGGQGNYYWRPKDQDDKNLICICQVVEMRIRKLK